MIVLVKDIPAYAFSSGLNELVFATDQNKAVLSLTVGEKEILSETYIPDASGRITINDLQGLIEPYLATNLIERCSYRITDGSSEQNKNFTVQFCAAESSMPAADFMAGYFLSTLMGEKITAIGRKEFVHLVTTEACPVTATCVYYRDEDGLSTREVSLRQVTDTDKIVTVEVSPELLVKPGFELVRYIIHAGVRTQTFSLDPDAPDVAPVLLFTNSFGCQETVYCTGTHALEPEYVRSTAYTNGMFRNYRIDGIFRSFCLAHLKKSAEEPQNIAANTCFSLKKQLPSENTPETLLSILLLYDTQKGAPPDNKKQKPAGRIHFLRQQIFQQFQISSYRSHLHQLPEKSVDSEKTTLLPLLSPKTKTGARRTCIRR